MRSVSLSALAQRTALAVAAPAVAAVVLSLGAAWWWPLELLTHFRPHYIVAIACGAALCCLARSWKWAALLGGFLLLLLPGVVELYLPVRDLGTAGRSIRLLTANVHSGNRDHEPFLELVRRESPDVILVMEVNREWQRSLESLADEFPHRVFQSREDNFGIALLSRLPAVVIEIREIGPAEVPSVLAQVDLGDGNRVHILGTHPLPPVSAEYAALRDEHIRAVAEQVNRLTPPVVVAGDLNTTSWSPIFRELVRTTGLRDSRRGFGIQPSWPGRRAWVGIPIDHVLTSPDIIVSRRCLGADIRSDHLPVVVDFVIAQSRDIE